MSKVILNKDQVWSLVAENRYPVDKKTVFLSRCIDGRYEKNLKSHSPNWRANLKINNLPALSIPGADLGELALILACANDFGFEVDYEKVFQTLVEVVGGLKNFSYHTDSYYGGLALGCDYFDQITKNLAAYNLQKNDLDFINKKLEELEKKGVKPTILEGVHNEGAILIVKGKFGIYPRFVIEFDTDKKETSVFIYQQTLVDHRHRALAKQLVDDQAVKLFPGLDEEYLYEILSEEVENHLLETVNRLAFDLPLFEVVFDNDGYFNLKALK